mmetsp:Transcript_15928/g.39847  ORF Transcript_15928/g.39847 Transcript_15928/m.39847 type:complete len:89 (+) Transcript_15928:639-905(+)
MGSAASVEAAGRLGMLTDIHESMQAHPNDAASGGCVPCNPVPLPPEQGGRRGQAELLGTVHRAIRAHPGAADLQMNRAAAVDGIMACR